MAVGGLHKAPAALPRGRRSDTYVAESWLGPRAGLDTFGNPPPNPLFCQRTYQTLAGGCRYNDYAVLAH